MLCKDQWTLGQHRILFEPCGLHTFLSLIIFTILQVAFSIIFSVMHERDVIIRENAIFFFDVSPKNSLGAGDSQVSSLGRSAVTPDSGSCPDSVLTG